MNKRLLGACGFLLFGTFGMLSGVASAHQDVVVEDMISEDMISEDLDPLYTEVRCLAPGSFACMEACGAIKAYCSQFILHPYKVESGTGALYWCKGGWPTYTCSYKFPNADSCHFVKPIGPKFCAYEGGK